MMSLIEVQNVSYTYRGKHQIVEALKKVSCTFDCGKLHVIKGPSGSGKTTLLSLLAGLDLPTEGEIKINGIAYGTMDRQSLRRDHVAVIFQMFNLFPLLTAQENVMFPMQLSGKNTREAKRTAAALLHSIGIREEQLKKYPGMLSGGEQQRVAIARALVNNPSLIIADEPTGNLDPARSLEILLLLQKINELGTTVLVVTHAKPLVDRLSERVIAIDGGRIISDGMDGYYNYEIE